MPKYEYKVLEAPHKYENNKWAINLDLWGVELNELGQLGWKVVGTGGSGAGNEYDQSENGWAILMRQK